LAHNEDIKFKQYSPKTIIYFNNFQVLNMTV